MSAVESIVLEEPRPDGMQRGRGGFLRNAKDVPYVTTADGAVVKSGPRKGERKRVAYGSTSGFGKLIEDRYSLEKWGERRTVLGIGIAPELLDECRKLATFDVDSDEYKAQADKIVARAKEAAKASLAADRGTHGHAILEDDETGQDWLPRAERGELLGISTEVQAKLVAAWRLLLEHNGIEILATEASCIDDAWKLAGTLDNLARATKDLTFVLSDGEIRTIPTGTVFVLDKKTGGRKVDAKGQPLYWHGYVLQVASYAQSLPYDTQTEERGEWPWPISQEHAVIAHIDLAGAIDGEPVENICSLTYADIAEGREAGGRTVIAAKAWAKHTALLSAQQIDAIAKVERPLAPVLEESIETTWAGITPIQDLRARIARLSSDKIERFKAEWTGPRISDVALGKMGMTVAQLAEAKRMVAALEVEPSEVESRMAAALTPMAAPVAAVVNELVEQNADSYRAWLVGRVEALKVLDNGIAAMTRCWPLGADGTRMPTFKQSSDHTPEQLQAIEKALTIAEAMIQAPFPAEQPGVELPDTLKLDAPPAPRSEVVTPPSEGESVPQEDMDYLIEQVQAIPGLVARAQAWVAEANASGNSYNLRRNSQRRFHLGRIILRTAELGEDIMRAYLAVVLDTDAALMPGIPYGQALGSLNHIEAARVMELVLADTPVTFADDGHAFVSTRQTA